MPRNAGSSLARASEPPTRKSGATSTTQKRRHPRPRLDLLDKLFWVAVRRFWSGWQQSLIAVTPETVVRWHRGGFRLYWKLISKVRRPVGRRQTSKEVQELIFRMVVENPTWGAPRIYRYTARAFFRGRFLALDDEGIRDSRRGRELRYFQCAHNLAKHRSLLSRGAQKWLFGTCDPGVLFRTTAGTFRSARGISASVTQDRELGVFA